MGRRIAISPTECTIVLLVVLALVQFATPVNAQPPMASAWVTQPVSLDGRMTTAEEWSDAIPVDLTFSNRLQPELRRHLSVRVWIKNDQRWIFLLASVKWPANDIDRRDRFRLYLYSGSTKVNGTIQDASEVYFDGSTYDGYGVLRLGQGWFYSDDDKMSPPGENNVKGAASYNGTHYWFELGKTLNTGDRYDFSLVPGQTYANAELNFRDISATSEEGNHNCPIILNLAPVLPSVGLTEPEHGAISGVSRVDFKAYILGHLSKVTLVVEAKDNDMKFNQERGLYESSLTLPDGVYKWRVNALGVLGNVSSIPERTLTVDTTKPVVTIRSPTSGEAIKKSEVLVSWEALDATSGIAKVDVKVDASDWIDVTGKTSHTVAWLGEGNHEVRVRATDRAGNIAEKVATFTFLPPPWYATYWYIPTGAVAAVAAIAAVMISRKRPPKPPTKPPDVKPARIEPLPKPPTRKQLLKELEELYRSGKITETAYRRLKKKYET